MLGIAMDRASPSRCSPQQYMASFSVISLSLKELPVLWNSPGRKASCPDSSALKQVVPGLLQQQLPQIKATFTCKLKC